MKGRVGKVVRKTTETEIEVEWGLDGTGDHEISTGLPFFDHMLSQMAKHGAFDVKLTAKGDLAVDAHHTVEDVGICLGQALKEALGDKVGIRRFGQALSPMMDALAQVALDVGGRPNLVYRLTSSTTRVGVFDVQLIEEFFKAFCSQAGVDLHVEVPYGENVHHMVEAVFKGWGRALREAVCPDERRKEVPSTKGML